MMGDHRATVKIEFDFHGKKYKMDSWVNYNGWDGVDSRVIEFFEKSWADGMSRYEEAQWKADEKKRKRETLEKEKKEYERLKKKYGD